MPATSVFHPLVAVVFCRVRRANRFSIVSQGEPYKKRRTPLQSTLKAGRDAPTKVLLERLGVRRPNRLKRYRPSGDESAATCAR